MEAGSWRNARATEPGVTSRGSAAPWQVAVPLRVASISSADRTQIESQSESRGGTSNSPIVRRAGRAVDSAAPRDADRSANHHSGTHPLAGSIGSLRNRHESSGDDCDAQPNELPHDTKPTNATQPVPFDLLSLNSRIERSTSYCDRLGTCGIVGAASCDRDRPTFTVDQTARERPFSAPLHSPASASRTAHQRRITVSIGSMRPLHDSQSRLPEATARSDESPVTHREVLRIDPMTATVSSGSACGARLGEAELGVSEDGGSNFGFGLVVGAPGAEQAPGSGRGRRGPPEYRSRAPIIPRRPRSETARAPGRLWRPASARGRRGAPAQRPDHRELQGQPAVGDRLEPGVAAAAASSAILRLPGNTPTSSARWPSRRPAGRGSSEPGRAGELGDAAAEDHLAVLRARRTASAACRPRA